MDRSFAGLPNPVPVLAASPSRSIRNFGTTGSDFDGGALGLIRSWSRMMNTRSGNPATAFFALLDSFHDQRPGRSAENLLPC